MTSVELPPRRRWGPGWLTGVSVLVLFAAGLTVLTPSTANAAATAQQGLQFGNLLNLPGCDRTPPINQYLGSADSAVLQQQTNWVRLDLRGAGGFSGSCSPTDAYASILADLANADPTAKVIGALTLDFVYNDDPNQWNQPDTFPTVAQAYAAAAANLVCDARFAGVDVWEIWNEENLPLYRVEPAQYADLLLRTVSAIRAGCAHGQSATLIVGGLNSAVVNGCDPVCYLQAVEAAITAAHNSTYPSLSRLVNGIGIHPYVLPYGDANATSGHQPLADFLYRFTSNGYTNLYVTEFGWPIGPDVDQTRQCQNLVRALQVFHDSYSSTVKAATYFSLQDSGEAFGLYDTTMAQKVAFNGYTAGNCDPVCPPSFRAPARSGGLGLDAGGTCPLPPPAAPYGQTATALSPTSIQVGWVDNSFNEQTFEIYNGVSTVSVPANTTSYTWSGLSPGTYMCFAIRAVNYLGTSAWTPYACTTTPNPPAAPSGQSATALAYNSIRVGWTDNSTNETSFQVYNGVSTVSVPANTTSYTWGGLAGGTYMCFAVRSVNASGTSAWTPYACTTTPAAPTPPAAPSGPTATALNGTSIRVGWTDNSTNETGFQIYNGVSTAMVAANTTSYTWSGLAPGTYMCFAVRSVNAAGNSSYTAYACTTTPTVPAAPSGQTAVAVSGSSIRVGWLDHSTNETSFQIYNGVSTVTVAANATSYTWGGLAPGTYMCFAVRSVNAAGTSAWTPYACTTTPTPPAAPTGQTATALSTSTIRVGWRDNSSNETSFQIYNGVSTVTVAANATTYTWGGLGSHTYMCFAVRSVNAAGTSAWSPYACTTTP